eukprot:TRINITY_DN322_c0_g1_i1.p1 TRINITY_DN322_c0_g1~~TRINITY_DN322_c0_g1_i1.p1  ORF type:complete len:126 (-),score=6.72 TRINITY_DN322_c0_g1_i1:98-475(-)
MTGEADKHHVIITIIIFHRIFNDLASYPTVLPRILHRISVLRLPSLFRSLSSIGLVACRPLQAGHQERSCYDGDALLHLDIFLFEVSLHLRGIFADTCDGTTARPSPASRHSNMSYRTAHKVWKP